MIEHSGSSPLWVGDTDGARGLRCFRHDAMACTWGVLACDDDAGYIEQAARAAFEEIDRIEREISRFIEHSDVARINALHVGEGTRVGAETLECLGIAQRIGNETCGAFNVIVGDKSRDSAQDPSPAQAERSPPTHPEPRASARANRSAPVHLRSTDTRESAALRCSINIDRNARTVWVDGSGVALDFGGIGKGYGIDQAAIVLRDWGIENALVCAGQSTVLGIGNAPDGGDWSLPIREPHRIDKTLATVRLRNRALSGSGRWLHGPHIIDPRTGQPAAYALGAWATAPSAAEADALSTAFMVLAPHEVADYCRRHVEVSAILCVKSRDGCRLIHHCYAPAPPE